MEEIQTPQVCYSFQRTDTSYKYCYLKISLYNNCIRFPYRILFSRGNYVCIIRAIVNNEVDFEHFVS